MPDNKPPKHILDILEALGLDPERVVVIGLGSVGDESHDCDSHGKHAYNVDPRYCGMDDATLADAYSDSHGGCVHEALYGHFTSLSRMVVSEGLPFCGHDATLMQTMATFEGMARFAEQLGILAYGLAYDATKGERLANNEQRRAVAKERSLRFVADMMGCIDRGVTSGIKRGEQAGARMMDLCDTYFKPADQYEPVVDGKALTARVLAAGKALRPAPKTSVH